VARARLTALVVDAKARGGGIGAILVAAAEEAGRAMGCGVLELTSGAGRLDAHRFYQREGFRSTSVRFSKDL
jgi:GNAT superfamily N-acetyltransferase